MESVSKLFAWIGSRLRPVSAQALGCEPMTVSRYERGSYAPSIEALEQIAEALGCTVEAFFASPPSPPVMQGHDDLRHALCDIAYHTSDAAVLKEIVESARTILSRTRSS
ncbi:helix-turn-helix domain-containing protein [Pseudomonas fragariae (ex Marin et al. 2024)]|uniref:helix-turn-helix domain-containing protein n=1 Tax=Pseudomonas fragariae (ex Marin et al. 2024) TaxID=3080056 RepID=UPI003F78F868